MGAHGGQIVEIGQDNYHVELIFQPDGGTILLVGPQLQSIRTEVDSDQWEVHVSGGSPHFVHHASRSVSGPSEAFHLFKARIAQGESDMVMSSYFSQPLVMR